MEYKNIIIHHSLTKDGAVVDWQAIRRYHTSWRYNGNIITKEESEKLIYDGKSVEEPWIDIGYNFGIERINNEYETLVGRSWNIPGAHTKGQNSNSIGVCCVGNYDEIEPPMEMIDKLVKLIITLVSTFGISVINGIQGHRAFAKKSCPGKLFDLQKLERYCLAPWKRNEIYGV